ncbi:MAG: PQQ-binding-like beta-propeller repeat protein [Saprospiraceae bacterium]
MALYDIDGDDTLEVIMPSSCNAKTFCFRGSSGKVQWQANTAGSDSPATLADIDHDGKVEILHGGFDGHVRCFNSEDGSVAWNKTVYSNCWIQTAPTIVDLNMDGELDFVVGTWTFGTDTNHIYAYTANNQKLLWSKPLPNHMYHGTTTADIDKDGKPELIFGDYNGILHALNGEDGSTLWEYQTSFYIGAPATIADLDKDGICEVIFCDAYGVGALHNNGEFLWYYTIPNFATAFRGVALGDIDGDDYLDVVFGSSKGRVTVLDGKSGTLIWDLDLTQDIGKSFDIDHAPLIADFDKDGTIDVFVVGGYTNYPDFQSNYGRAYMISAGIGTGPDWLMFQHDLQRQSSICEAILSTENLSDKTGYLNIFPNPCTDHFEIETNYSGIAELRNIDGLILQTIRVNASKTNVPLDNIPSGMYFVSLKTAKGILVQKLVLK